MSLDRDITQLLLPTMPLSRDDYGKEFMLPRPLYFDRVNEAKAPITEAILFSLPFEIIGQILEGLPRSSLASLALVSRDFRQLARSRQFATINLDYSDHSVALVKKLLAEADIRSGSYGGSHSISQSLGVCIRRVSVATDPAWIGTRHKIALLNGYTALSERIKNGMVANANQRFFNDYLPKIQSLLSSKVVLPHLECLDWRDKIILSRSFFERLPSTSIQHLRLHGVKINEEFEIKLLQPLKSWSLRTLHLEVSPWLDAGLHANRPSTCQMCASILRLCASTLESLTWRTFFINAEHHTFATPTFESAPQFRRLRSLRLRTVIFSDYTMLDALLESDLRELEINPGQDSLYSEFFEERGTMPALTTLVWDGEIKAQQSLSFLQANTQLTKLSFQWQVSDDFLQTKLLPLLTTSFRNLTSLSLKWKSDAIPDSALEAIGSLEPLRQLHLSAGYQNGWRYCWLIDHELMRSNLRNLTAMKRLAFSRDTYDNGVDTSDPESYYEDRIHTRLRPNPLHPEMHIPEWEVWHRESGSTPDKGSGLVLDQTNDIVDMLTEARRYAMEMPELDWMYFGQHSIQITRDITFDGSFDAFALSKQRDQCWTYLREMFGWKATSVWSI